MRPWAPMTRVHHFVLQLPNKHVQEPAEFLSRLSLLRFTLGTRFVLGRRAGQDATCNVDKGARARWHGRRRRRDLCAPGNMRRGRGREAWTDKRGQAWTQGRHGRDGRGRRGHGRKVDEGWAARHVDERRGHEEVRVGKTWTR